MTDAGEKLREEKLQDRLNKFFEKYGRIGGNNGANQNLAIQDAIRTEIERAAGIADISGETVIAAAIRKLKE